MTDLSRPVPAEAAGQPSPGGDGPRRHLPAPPVLEGGSVVTADAELVVGQVLCGGEPGSGKSFHANLFAAHAALGLSVCQACPPDCPSCSGDGWTCECDGHGFRYPDYLSDDWDEVA